MIISSSSFFGIPTNSLFGSALNLDTKAFCTVDPPHKGPHVRKRPSSAWRDGSLNHVQQCLSSSFYSFSASSILRSFLHGGDFFFLFRIIRHSRKEKKKNPPRTLLSVFFPIPPLFSRFGRRSGLSKAKPRRKRQTRTAILANFFFFLLYVSNGY